MRWPAFLGGCCCSPPVLATDLSIEFYLAYGLCLPFVPRLCVFVIVISFVCTQAFYFKGFTFVGQKLPREASTLRWRRLT